MYPRWQKRGNWDSASFFQRKKAGFLADSKYLKHKGFLLANSAAPYFELWYLPFSADSKTPHFRSCVNKPPAVKDAFTLYYTHRCPYTAQYIPLLQNVAELRGVTMNIIHIESRDQTQNAPYPFTTFALYHNGEFVTHEIQSVPKFEKIMDWYCEDGRL